MIIINGINSEIVKKILPKLLKNDNIVGIYNKNYTGIKNKKLILFKNNRSNLKKIQYLIKNHKKIVFINFAAKRDEKLLVNLKEKDFSNIIDNNLTKTIIIIKTLLPEMIKMKYGRVVFISSSTAESGYPGNIGYSASKSALKGISGTISKEYKDFNITSNIISLGYFQTKMWFSLPKNKRSKLISNTLNKKTGDFEAIYQTIKLLIKFDTINMSTIYLDGGNLSR
jgi:NAD(P)-dependent dehydrogenase (short-subunit alcohol dehydrogenase family)